MDKDAIVLEVRKNSSLMGKDNVVAVYLFGSMADGTGDSFSDIDICIIDDRISWGEKLEITGEFGDDYYVSFGTLREYEDFRPLIQKRIFERFGRCMI